MIGKLLMLLAIVLIITSVVYVEVKVGTNKDFQPNAICRKINNTVECEWITENETEIVKNAPKDS